MKTHLNAILLLIICFANICVNANQGLADPAPRSNDFVLLADGLNGTAGGDNSSVPVQPVRVSNLSNASGSPKTFNVGRMTEPLQEPDEPDPNQAVGSAQASDPNETSQAAEESDSIQDDIMGVKGVQVCYNCTLIVGDVPE